MALQTSGAISINDLRTEFGDTPGSDSLSEYYRGGAYVPNITQNNSIPTGGTIRLSNFYGATNAPPMPYVERMRRSSTANAVYTSHSVVSGIAHARSYINVRLRRYNRQVRLEVWEAFSSASSIYYLTTGSQGALSTAAQTMGTFDGNGASFVANIDLALSWSLGGTGAGTFTAAGNTSSTFATYAAQNGVYRTCDAGRSIGMQIRGDIISECFANQTANRFAYIIAQVKQDGFSETIVGEYRIQFALSARSNACL